MTSKPEYYRIAESLLGTKEGAGAANNPVIVQMYADVGQPGVKDDATAWCAAFVGSCLERAGIRSTRKLTARSYLAWGEQVDPASAREGDIVVFARGNSAWQGHVAFFVKASGQTIEVLGGNQSNAVTRARYSRDKLLGIRRPAKAPATPDGNVRDVQEQLKALGYHEVGTIDGKMGPRTRAAILAFRVDNGLPLEPKIDKVLLEAIADGAPREVAPERATGKPVESRIVSSANAQIATGIVGTVTVAAGQIAPVVQSAEDAKGITQRAINLFGLGDLIAPYAPWIIGLVCLVVVFYGIRTRMARIADYREGKTP